jgi:hypothetical protein
MRLKPDTRKRRMGKPGQLRRIFTETNACSLSGCRCTAEKARDRSSGVIPPAPQAAGIARGGQAVYGVIMEA